jgi:hypothetical protein
MSDVKQPCVIADGSQIEAKVPCSIEEISGRAKSASPGRLAQAELGHYL